MGSLGPCVKNLIFEVGHDQSPDKGQLLTETFSATLRGLRRRIRAENLVIALQDNCWGSTEELQDFTDALANVQVAKSFELSGSAFHLYLNMRSIPQALAMKVQPDKSTYQGSTAVDARGYFCDNYSSTKILAETDPTGKDIVDATAKQIRYLAAQIPPV